MSTGNAAVSSSYIQTRHPHQHHQTTIGVDNKAKITLYRSRAIVLDERYKREISRRYVRKLILWRLGATKVDEGLC